MSEDQALALLQNILARPEYQVDRSTPWWAVPMRALLDLLNYLVERLVQVVVDASTGRTGPIGVVVLAVCIAIGAVAAVYLVRAVRMSVTREDRLGSANLAERRERSERLWQTAQQLAAAGQYAEAVRVVYLSALYALDERALLHVETSLTNAEHARALSQLHPSIGHTFGDVVQHYDRLRYGRFEVTSSSFADLSKLVARARSASLQGSTT